MFFLSFLFQAQATTIDVTLVDSTTGELIDNATAICLPVQEGDTTKNRRSLDGILRIECAEGKREIEIFHEFYGKSSFPFSIEGEKMQVRLRISSPAELVIESEKREGEITKHVITAAELKSVPGTFGDPIKALQSLPGVSRSNFGDGSVVVRGAEGINTGFYVDGMPVPYMFHTLVGRSVIIPNFIDDIEFFPGGMPSKYGEVTQSVVNIRTDTEKIAGTKLALRVDFLDGGLSVEQKISEHLTLRTAGRYSWVGGLISTASKVLTKRAGGESYEASYLAPQYWDYFGDLRWKQDQNSFGVMVLGSRDMLVFREGRFDEDGDGKPDPLDWEEADLSYNPSHWIENHFTRVRLRWIHEDDIHQHETWIATGTEQQQNLLGAWWLSRQGPYRGRVQGPSITVRRDDRILMESWGSQNSYLVLGGQYGLRNFTAEDFQETFNVDNYEDIVEISTKDLQQSLSLWMEPQIQWERTYIGLGLRGAMYSWENNLEFQPEPRFSMRYELPQQWLLKGAIGRYTQMPPIERYAQGIGNPDLNLMKAWQVSVGGEGELGYGIQIDSSVFAGYMDDLVIRDLEVDTYNNGDRITSELQPYYLGVTGVSYGWEMLLRIKPNQFPFWGWVSLTTSKALRLDATGRRFPSDYDQPLSLTVVGAYDLPKKWTFSSRVQFTSGQPFTPLYGVYIPNDQSFAAIRGELNADRYDPFFRWDLRLEKTYHRRLVDWLLYLDVYNVTSRSNPFIATYNYDYSDLYDLAAIPIIPTLGFEVQY